MFSINYWTKEFPTKENHGQWFFVKSFDGIKFIQFMQVRWDKERKTIYLCPECHKGVTSMSYGTMLNLFPKDSIEFCGPIKMPPDYKIVNE